MHVELPASVPLGTLDAFLRGIWLECCGHLSGFKINGTSYDSEPEYFDFDSIQIVGQEENTDETTAVVEQEQDEADEEDDVTVAQVLDSLPTWYQEALSSEWLAEFRNCQSFDAFEALLHEKLAATPLGRFPQVREEYEAYSRRKAQRNALELLLTMVEDRSLDVLLAKVLSVGQKFTYEYDYGSTTDLNLRVLAERESRTQDKMAVIAVMARNKPPVIPCQVCGKPATRVAGGYYNPEESGYCDTCAPKEEDEMLLPVVNSPRVGVCGYTGGYDEEDNEIEGEVIDAEETAEKE